MIKHPSRTPAQTHAQGLPATFSSTVNILTHSMSWSTSPNQRSLKSNQSSLKFRYYSKLERSLWSFCLLRALWRIRQQSCPPCLFKNQGLPPKSDGFYQVWNTLHLYVVLCLKLLISLRGRKRNRPARTPNPTSTMPSRGVTSSCYANQDRDPAH